jgi:hypothetical protein
LLMCVMTQGFKKQRILEISLSLSLKLVETNKYNHFKLVYLLLKFLLILPIATASVERVFSAMNHVETSLRNKMGDRYLNDCLVIFIQ